MRTIYKKILLILNVKERKALYALLLADIVVNLIDVTALFLLIFVISYCTHQPVSNKVGSLFSQWFQPDSGLFLVGFLLFFAIKSFGGYYTVHKRYHFVYGVASRLSGRNILRYFEGGFASYVNVDSSTYIRRISHQPIEFAHYVLDGAIMVIIEVTLLLLTIAGILLFNVKLFLLLTIVIGPPMVVVAIVIKRKLRKIRADIKPGSQKTLQYLNEALSSYVESNIYNKNDFFSSRYASNQKKLNTYLASMHGISGISPRLIEVFAVAGLFVLIWANKYLGNTHVTEIINIAAFMAAAYKIIPGIVKVTNAAAQMRTYNFALEDLLLNDTPLKTGIVAGAEKITALRFDNVSFSYPQKKVLKDLNLSLTTGDIAGISAPSGTGKTTIVNLLLGFIEQQSGSISFNDKETDMARRQAYWGSIAYVKQNPFVINDTLISNITLGDSHHDEERLQHAISFAGLTPLIDSTPQGLQMPIAENGKNISGGQRQRITLARAIYKGADVIILDEPFNELDEQAEIAFLKNFQELAQSGKIIILITHNKTGLSYCNKIITLHENRD